MGKDDELDRYREQGARHASDGEDCPPSDRLPEVVMRSLAHESTITEADAAYQEGRDSLK